MEFDCLSLGKSQMIAKQWLRREKRIKKTTSGLHSPCQKLWWSLNVLGLENSNHSVNPVSNTKMCNKKTTSGLSPPSCNTLYPTGPFSYSHNLLRKHVRHTWNHCGTPIPVCLRSGGRQLKWIGSVLNSNNSSRKHVGRSQVSHDQVWWSWSSCFRLFASVSSS